MQNTYLLPVTRGSPLWQTVGRRPPNHSQSPSLYISLAGKLEHSPCRTPLQPSWACDNHGPKELGRDLRVGISSPTAKQSLTGKHAFALSPPLFVPSAMQGVVSICRHEGKDPTLRVVERRDLGL